MMAVRIVWIELINDLAVTNVRLKYENILQLRHIAFYMRSQKNGEHLHHCLFYFNSHEKKTYFKGNI